MKQAVYIFLGLGAIGTAFYFINKNKKGKGNGDAYSQYDDFVMLQQNLGIKAGKENVVVAPFNEKKNVAQFYPNKRVVILNNKGQYLVKGSYTNGGMTINLDNGKILDSNSVWKNIIDAIK